MVDLWDPESKIRLERQLWIAVMRAQQELGVAIPAGAPEKYEAVIDTINLESIAERERVTKHDVKARIEEFNELAGAENIHLGMTSRDLTENVEQLQIRLSLILVRDKSVAALDRLSGLAVALLGTCHGWAFTQCCSADHNPWQAHGNLRRRTSLRS